MSIAAIASEDQRVSQFRDGREPARRFLFKATKNGACDRARQIHRLPHGGRRIEDVLPDEFARGIAFKGRPAVELWTS